MQITILYVSTLAIFLILDAVMLTFVMKPLFTRHIGPLLIEPIRFGPAALFYAAYIAGLLYLVSVPALRTDSPVIVPSMIIGAMAYGTYEFTSYAIMRDWSWQLVATDLTWGTIVTAVCAWGGLAITRAIMG